MLARFSLFLLAGLIALSSPALAQNNNPPKIPSFQVDANWPLPLPAPVDASGEAHPWVTGEVGGTCVDAQDNVFTFNRGWEVGVTVGAKLMGANQGAISRQEAIKSAIPSPPVLAYDGPGKVVAAWGDPSLVKSGPNAGYAAYLPNGAHGCFVDYTGAIWLTGSVDGIVQKYDLAEAQKDGEHAKFLLQIGTKGECDAKNPAAPGANTYTSCNEQDDTNSSHTRLNEPADVTVDPNIGPVSHGKGDVYIADGYGNHRIVVFDAAGKYVGQWGTACKIDGKPTNSDACAPGTFGATGGGHPHCVVLGNDGLVYVCDRPNNRIQVFDRKCAVPSTPDNPEPICQPTRIIPINSFGQASAGNQKAIARGGERATDIDFWPVPQGHAETGTAHQDLIVDVDLGNDNAWLIDKVSGQVVGAIGACGLSPCPGHGAGHFAFGHMIAADSKGNVYVGETITGRRIQKFVPQDH